MNSKFDINQLIPEINTQIEELDFFNFSNMRDEDGSLLLPPPVPLCESLNNREINYAINEMNNHSIDIVQVKLNDYRAIYLYKYNNKYYKVIVNMEGTIKSVSKEQL